MHASPSSLAKESFRDTPATINGTTGKRVWMYPKQPKGYYHRLRAGVAALLLGLFFSTPFIQVQGHPFFLFNVWERKFILFGYPFFPQDVPLLGLAMLGFFGFVILFTRVFGRVWCGWACPQTLFMEMVFRKIEYWIEGDASQQKALDKSPWTANKMFRKGLKHLLFIGIALLIAHTVMAYLVGPARVKTIVTHSPAANWPGFVGLLAFTVIFYVVFARLRELACTVICPYGRLQSILISKKTIVVAYDFLRGEPRGKRKQAQKATDATACTGNCIGCKALHLHQEKPGSPADASRVGPNFTLNGVPLKGDCVDCKLCVQVCPMGIDIRNGLQMECINCTACLDACDSVMEKIGKPKGLIRLDSMRGVAEKKSLQMNTRIGLYVLVMTGLLGLMGFMLGSREQVEASVLRVPGMLYQQQPNGRISNLYTVRLINKTYSPMQLRLKLENQTGTIGVAGNQVVVPAGDTEEVVCLIELRPQDIHQAKTPLTIGIYQGDTPVQTLPTSFIGPVTQQP